MKIKNTNVKTTAKILALVLATGITAHEFVLTKQTENIKVPFKKVVEEFQDDTLLDEAEEKDATYNGVAISEAADKVLNLIDLSGPLCKEDKKWLEENAKEVTEETMLWAIKSSVANEINIPVESIQKIGLPYTNEYKDLVLCMTYDGTEYQISKKEKYLIDAVYLYYQIKSSSPQEDTNYKMCKTGLNYAKILTMTGINEENNILERKRDLKEAKRMLKK